MSFMVEKGALSHYVYVIRADSLKVNGLQNTEHPAFNKKVLMEGWCFQPSMCSPKLMCCSVVMCPRASTWYLVSFMFGALSHFLPVSLIHTSCEGFRQIYSESL